MHRIYILQDDADIAMLDFSKVVAVPFLVHCNKREVVLWLYL